MTSSQAEIEMLVDVVIVKSDGMLTFVGTTRTSSASLSTTSLERLVPPSALVPEWICAVYAFLLVGRGQDRY